MSDDRHTRHLVVTDTHPFGQQLQLELLVTHDPDRVERTDSLATAKVLIPSFAPTDLYLVTDPFPSPAAQHPALRWHRQTHDLLDALNLALQHGFRLFYPSSVAVFGPSAPKCHCPDDAPQAASSMYALNKRAGERWCEQYRQAHSVDVRCIRFPVLVEAQEVSDDSLPGGRGRSMPNAQARPVLTLRDAVRAVVQLMAAPKGAIRRAGAYNIGGVIVSPTDLARELSHCQPGTTLGVWNPPDEPGPVSLDDSAARTDWGWQSRRDLLSLLQQLLPSR